MRSVDWVRLERAWRARQNRGDGREHCGWTAAGGNMRSALKRMRGGEEKTCLVLDDSIHDGVVFSRSFAPA